MLAVPRLKRDSCQECSCRGMCKITSSATLCSFRVWLGNESAEVAARPNTQKHAFLYPWASPVVAPSWQTQKTKRVKAEIGKKKGDRANKKRRAVISATDLGGLFPGSDVTDVPGGFRKRKKKDGLITSPNNPGFGKAGAAILHDAANVCSRDQEVKLQGLSYQLW